MEDKLLDTQFFIVTMMDDQDKELNAIIHFLSTCYALEGFSTNQKKHLVVRVANYMLIVGHMYKLGVDELLQ